MSKNAPLNTRNLFSSPITDKDNFFTIAGIPVDASDQEIRKAYKTLSLRYHPDRNPGNEVKASEIFQAIGNALEHISNNDLPPEENSQEGVHSEFTAEFSARYHASKNRNDGLEQEELFKKELKRILKIINPKKSDIPVKGFGGYQEVGECYYHNKESNLIPEEDKALFNGLSFIEKFLRGTMPDDAVGNFVTTEYINPRYSAETNRFGHVRTRIPNKFINAFTDLALNRENFDAALSAFEQMQNFIYYQEVECQAKHPLIGIDCTFGSEFENEGIIFSYKFFGDAIDPGKLNLQLSQKKQELENIFGSGNIQDQAVMIAGPQPINAFIINFDAINKFFEQENLSQEEVSRRVTSGHQSHENKMILSLLEQDIEQNSLEKIQDKITFLTERNVDLDKIGLLTFAAEVSSLETVKYLYQILEITPEQLNQKVDGNGNTILRYAADALMGESDENRIGIIVFLINSGASADVTNKYKEKYSNRLTEESLQAIQSKLDEASPSLEVSSKFVDRIKRTHEIAAQNQEVGGFVQKIQNSVKTGNSYGGIDR